MKDDWSGDYENSSAVHYLCDGNKLLLYKCRRANEGGEELFDLYKSVMDGKEDKSTVDMLKDKPEIDTELNIAFTHKTRKRGSAASTSARSRPVGEGTCAMGGLDDSARFAASCVPASRPFCP